jgi:leucyl-tRNA synthetase
VNGKPRGELLVPVSAKDDQEQITALARELPRVKPLLDGKTERRVIYVPGKMLNLVVG